MLLIQMPRGFGKSTIIAKLMAADDNSVCLVVNRQMAEHMARILADVLADRSGAPLLGRDVSKLTETRFVTPHQWMTTGRMKRPGKVYVDDLDIVLGALLGVGVDVAAYSPSSDGY